MDKMVNYNELKRFYKGKRVFITGHTGFKGSWLCLLLNQMESEIKGYALEPPTKPCLFEQAKVEKLIKHEIGDIRNQKQLLESIKEFKPEIVFHLAAQPLVRESYKIPVETYEINVIGTVNLLDSIRQNTGVKALVNITTDKCYDNKEWLWPYRENDTLGGYDPYSNSKACSELVTSAFSNSYFNPEKHKEHGLAIATARAGNVIGGGDWATDRLIPDFIKAIIKGDRVNIRNPRAIRPWQHVLEPLTGYLMLAQLLYTKGPEFAGAWNFGPDDRDAKDVEWIIKKIGEFWGNNASYCIENETLFHEAGYLKLDCSKAKSKLGWYPRWDIETSLHSIVDWLKAHQKGEDIRNTCIRQINNYFKI